MASDAIPLEQFREPQTRRHLRFMNHLVSVFRFADDELSDLDQSVSQSVRFAGKETFLS